MLILALDTALDHCQAAVIDAAGARGGSGGPAAGDAERVANDVEAAMSAAGVRPDQIERVVVTVGPGSFTGVRVGLAYAKGFALARGVPALGVTTLEALARTFGAPCVVTADARHGAVFAALFDKDFVPHRMARVGMDDARAMAAASGVALIGTGGPADLAVERVELARLYPIGLEAAEQRPPTARYLAAVDAAPQRHKALARA